MQVWPASPAPEPSWAGGLTRPLDGEPVSGDGYAVRVAEGRRQVLVCDGLGHGPLAAAATEAALAAFRGRAGRPTGRPWCSTCTARMAHTRGAALAVAELAAGRRAPVRRPRQHRRPWSVEGDGGRRGLVSLPGIAGHQRPAVREYDYPSGPARRW